MNPIQFKPVFLLPIIIIFCLGILFIEQLGLGDTDSNLSLSELIETPFENITVPATACDLDGNTDTGIHFMFTPSAQDQPFQRRAIVSIFAAVADNKTYNTGLADVLVLAHSFNSSTEADREGTEFVAAYTGDLTATVKKSFLDLGVRLLALPDLGAQKNWVASEDAFKACPLSNCFAKLYLFGLEEFSDILYVDSSVVFNAGFSISSVFELSSGTGFFGAVPSFGLGDDVLDSSVLLFKPSISRMNYMLNLVSKLDFEEYFLDQSFLNNYFSGSIPSCTTWSRLPEYLNVQFVNNRNHEVVSSSQIASHNFWHEKPSSKNPAFTIYSRWVNFMHSLFDFQMKKYKYSDVGRIPNSIEDLELMIQGNTFNQKFVILTVMSSKVEQNVSDRTMGNRARYCERHPEVTHYLETNIKAKNAVWQKVWTLEELFESDSNHYNWAWLLDGRDAFIMNGETELRALVAKYALERPEIDMDVLIACDLNALNAGSFFVRNSEWTRKVLIPEWKGYANHSDKNTREHPWQEQWGLIRMYEDNRNNTPKHLHEVHQSRQNEFNAYTFGPEPTYRPGDFALHAPDHGWKGLYSYMDLHNYTEY
ncbi:hypothetical protein HDU79_004219 [Rhizoclosmatium sp. JEL0117]|nr:hypothetical protein HDU79_004219 [Rhizoclosmatium sp. JEL0117]